MFDPKTGQYSEAFSKNRKLRLFLKMIRILLVLCVLSVYLCYCYGAPAPAPDPAPYESSEEYSSEEHSGEKRKQRTILKGLYAPPGYLYNNNPYYYYNNGSVNLDFLLLNLNDC